MDVVLLTRRGIDQLDNAELSSILQQQWQKLGRHIPKPESKPARKPNASLFIFDRLLPSLPESFPGANHCRFYPTCSSYARDAVSSHGVIRAVTSPASIGECHPWHEGG